MNHYGEEVSFWERLAHLAKVRDEAEVFARVMAEFAPSICATQRESLRAALVEAAKTDPWLHEARAKERTAA